MNALEHRERLKSDIAEEIRRELKKEDALLHTLFSDVIDDHAYLWDHITEFTDLEKLRGILLHIIRLFLMQHQRDLTDLKALDKQRFSHDFQRLLIDGDALLQKTRNLQITEIEDKGIDEWYDEFLHDIQEIRRIIIQYTFRYSPETGKKTTPINLHVPFYVAGSDKGAGECGIASFKMVAAYLGKNISKVQAKKLCAFDRYSVMMTGVARGLAFSGFSVDVYLPTMNMPDEELLTYTYFQQHPEKIAEVRRTVEKMRLESTRKGARFHEAFYPTEDIIRSINEHTLAILQIDLSAIGVHIPEGEVSHAVVLVGHLKDHSTVFIHDPAQGPHIPVATKTLDAARKTPRVHGEALIVSSK